jgi:hypothetical protein
MGILLHLFVFYLLTFLSIIIFKSSMYILLFALCLLLTFGCMIVIASMSYSWQEVKGEFKDVGKISIIEYVMELILGLIFAVFNYLLIKYNLISVPDPKTFLFVATVYFLFHSMVIDAIFKLIKSQVKDIF